MPALCASSSHNTACSPVSLSAVLAAVFLIHQSRACRETHFMSLKTGNNPDGILLSVRCPCVCLQCILPDAWSGEKDIRCMNKTQLHAMPWPSISNTMKESRCEKVTLQNSFYVRFKHRPNSDGRYRSGWWSRWQGSGVGWLLEGGMIEASGGLGMLQT